MYYRQAKEEGFRARSAFKLLQVGLVYVVVVCFVCCLHRLHTKLARLPVVCLCIQASAGRSCVLSLSAQFCNASSLTHGCLNFAADTVGRGV